MTSAQEEKIPENADDGGWVGIFVRRPILALVLNLLDHHSRRSPPTRASRFASCLTSIGPS